MNQRFYYICNVFEKSVKAQRNITTDSPAANAKVSRICSAVRSAGGDARIISLGRGRSIGTLKRYSATARKISNVPIVYLDHWDVPVLTHLVTMISLCFMVLRLTEKGSVLVFYNFQLHYLAALIVGRLLGRRCILDIEDGFRSDDRSIRNIPNSVLLRIFNVCCNGGAMLASSSLKGQTPALHTYVCYGVAEALAPQKNWSDNQLQILFGGSLLKDTGASLFLETLKLLQDEHPGSLEKIRFVVTGFGDFAEHIQKAALGTMKGFLSFKGNVTSNEYREIMTKSHVGLCLKMPSSSMGATTFPSKVIELAANGLLVVSTRVSDVPVVFDSTTAFLLDEATPQLLVNIFLDIVDHPKRAQDVAIRGQNRITSMYSEQKIGSELIQFWQGKSAKQ